MKIRTGFVSNSSSSSFIIGILNVNNISDIMPKFIFRIEDIIWDHWSGEPTIQIQLKHDPIDNNYISRVSVDTETETINDEVYFRLKLTSFDDTEVSCMAKDGDKIFGFYGVGPDDDYWFYDEKNGYMDYDKISLDDFPKEFIEKYELVKKLGGEVNYGAGRNG